ncbi:hypothetical protein [Sphingobium sp.]|uniref:hypothetical protein n=1 Tax=Sphingobium sp. TaxID=1912891 RepID=UPI002C210A95|nr:hypothetical protein [Sphingobium sp.]HUD95047.1 hypothetical protein [Sphingobium sp.]
MSSRSTSVKALFRRPSAERQALALLRSDSIDPDTMCGASQKDRAPHLLPFAQLRSLAMGLGYDVQPTAAPYVSDGELELLTWLARGQRVSNHVENFHEDMFFTRALLHCSGILTGLGIHLPSMTMAGAIQRPRAEGETA